MDEDLKKILDENLKVSKEILEMTKYIKNYIFWSKIWGTIKLIVIILPLIIGYIFLIPMLKDTFGKYQDILNDGQTQGQTQNFSLDQLQNMLKAKQ
jgi:hypothetical protein